jgi:hypothetical protein
MLAAEVLIFCLASIGVHHSELQILWEDARWVHSGTRSICEVSLQIDYNESEIVIGRTTIFRFEAFLQNFVGCLGQSISRLTKLMNSFDDKFLSVTSEKSIWRQNQKVVVICKFLSHNFRFWDDQRFVLSVPKGSCYCKLALNFASQNSSIRPQDSVFLIGSWRRVIWT